MNRRTAIAAAAVGLGLVAGGLALWNATGPSPTPTRPGCLIGAEQPCSAKVETGKAYRYQVPHCGLAWVVDFDGSHWDVDKATMTEEENGRFGINSDEGTMTLRSEDVAFYRSDRGGDATLHRQTRPPSPSFCG